MDPITDDPDRSSSLDDSKAWSGSEDPEYDPEGPYCSQDEDHYRESESDTELQDNQESLFQALDPELDGHPEDPPEQYNPEPSSSDYSQEDERQELLRSGKQIDSSAEEQDSGSNSGGSPGSVSECSAHHQEDHQPSDSGSSSAGTPPQLRKHLAQNSLESAESEDEGKEGRAAGEGGEGGGGIEAAPPASYVSDGIQAQSAEQAEQWGAAFLTETTRASRQRARHTCLRRSEGQTERHLKEAKSKCKRIAQLLTAAPNPKSRGVLMFKKRRQRARKFTLVSYGTGKPTDDGFEDEYGFEEDSAGQDFRCSLQATSDSEFDEDYSFHVQGQSALNFYYEYSTQDQGLSASYNCDKMEQLPQTKGKGVMMFAQRRQRIDEITAQHEEMRQKGIPVEAFLETETPAPPVPAFIRQESAPGQQEVQAKQQLQYQEQQYQLQQYQQQQYQQQMSQPLNTGINGVDPYQMSSVSKSLVSNRTAKPFLGGLNQSPTTYSPVKNVPSPIPKKPDNIFKVPVPVNTSPQVWSPTGDVIASRDERIAVPAIKSGILPEAKKRGSNKSRDVPPEEDYLSLGAEACNFMQAPSVRQKKPPPVLPKPAINPACPPWSSEGHASHSPLQAASSHAPAQQPQPATKPWTPSPTQPVPQQHMAGWVPSNPSASYQPTWPSEPQQTSVSIKTPTTPHATPSQSKGPRTTSQVDANSVSSCPPQRGSSYLHASKAPPASPRGHASETGLSDGPAFKGKGAELFARRQSRMEKFVVDAETVQANRDRPPSPTLSMPSTWKYSPNIRAPPPVSYNPIVSPFYPLAAQKQPPPSSSPNAKSKENQGKPKAAPKHLSVVDVMKHQPYQLDTSLFTYNSTPEVKGPSPKTSPVPPPESRRTPSHTPSHLQPTVSGRFPSPTMSPSPVPSSGSTQSLKQGAPAKPGGPVYSRSRSMSLPRRLSSMSTLSPLSSPGIYPTRSPLERHLSWVEPFQKPLSPWEAAARSPLGLVEEAFGPQSVQEAISSSVHSAAHRKSLPEPPLEWKRRVSNDPIPPPRATPPTLSITLPARPSVPDPEKLIVYGPPFRPAQPLTIGIRYTGSSSLPRNFTLQSGGVPAHRVSWRM
ncbi:synaptopodin-2 [Astyanax mexicanus]|uniref:synaptopodin-2 n=1 Tax=Astyanax mexicanus TaxID=7994 RepID=UPI0020CAFC6C|nr:synaptopodin-2 [Astyanax mexicanus]